MRRPFTILAATALAGCGSSGAPAPAATPTPAPAARAPAGDPTSLAYAPGTHRFRLESTVHSVTEVMGQSQVQDGSTTMLISAVVTPAGGNLAAAITVDSVSQDGQAAGPAGADFGVLRGKVYHAIITPTGVPVSMTMPDTTDLVVVQIGETLRDFFPSLPPAPVSTGQAWTDTASSSIRQATGMSIRTRTIRQHRVTGWESRDGARALHVASTSTYTMSGEGESQGQSLQLTGTGTAMVDRFVSAGGVFLGQSGSDSANIMVNVLNMGLEVPIRQTRRTTITRLP